jgi:hypothetical protein
MRGLAFILLLLAALGAEAQHVSRRSFYRAPVAASGGGSGGTCPATNAPTISQAGSTGSLTVNSDAPYLGQTFTWTTNITFCGARLKMSAAGGETNLTLRIYALVGGTITPGSPVAESDVIKSSPFWSLTEVYFPFTTPAAITAGDYAIVVTANGGSTTAAVVTLYKNTSGTINGHHGAWFANGSAFDPGDGSDTVMDLFWF